MDVAVLAWEGASTVCDKANAIMKAKAIAPIEKTSLRIVGSFGCEIDVKIVPASRFKRVPSQAKKWCCRRILLVSWEPCEETSSPTREENMS